MSSRENTGKAFSKVVPGITARILDRLRGLLSAFLSRVLKMTLLSFNELAVLMRFLRKASMVGWISIQTGHKSMSPFLRIFDVRGTKRPPMRVFVTTKSKLTRTLMVNAIAPVLLRRRFFFVYAVALGRIRII